MWVAEGIARGSDSGEEPERRCSDSTDWPRKMRWIHPRPATTSRTTLLSQALNFRDEGGLGIQGCPGSIEVQFCLGYCDLGEKNSFDKEQRLP